MPGGVAGAQLNGCLLCRSGWIQFAGAEAGGIMITVVPSPDLPVAPVLPVAPSLPVAPWGPAGPGTATGVAGTLTTVGFLSQAASVSMASSAKISVEFFIGNPFKTRGTDEFWSTAKNRHDLRCHSRRLRLQTDQVQGIGRIFSLLILL